MADVTVLMAVYNGEPYLAEAIESVLAQTYPDFELLIVDDGSTDASAAICRGYTDPRIRLVQLPANRGLSEALNAGLRACATELVARLDADDVAEPQRLAAQREVMRARPSLALLGAQATAMTPEGAVTGTVHRSVDAASIRWFSAFDNPFAHTTVMFRASVIRDELGGFRSEYDPFSQDYDLWCRVMERHEVANLPERLVRHRVHRSSIMGSLDEGREEYRRKFDRIARELIARQAARVFGEALTAEGAALLPGLVLGLAPAQVPAFLETFETLLTQFRQRYAGTRSEDFRETLARQFDALAMHIHPPSRAAAAAIYTHVVRHHPDVTRHVSWMRALTLSVLGRDARSRVGQLSRRYLGALVD